MRGLRARLGKVPCVFTDQISGGQGIRTTCENTGKTANLENRETGRTLNSNLPNIEAHASEALNNLIELWPTLSLAGQNRIFDIAVSEAGIQSQNASGKRGAE